MAELEEIVRTCVEAFHDGSEFITRIQARDKDEEEQRLSPKEVLLQEMLQESLQTSEQAVSSHFEEEQQTLGEYAELLRRGDEFARQELLFVALGLQREILHKLSLGRGEHDSSETLKSLLETTISRRQDAIHCITELRKRLLIQLAPENCGSVRRRTPAGYPPASSSAGGYLTVDGARTRDRGDSWATTTHNGRFAPSLTDNLDAMTVQESIFDADRYTLAPETPYHPPPNVVPSSSRHAPQPQHLRPFSFHDAASIRAAVAPEPLHWPPQPIHHQYGIAEHQQRLSPDSHADDILSTMQRPRYERPSIQDSIGHGSDSMPSSSRVLSNLSLPSPSSSPRISNPDSVISLNTRHNRAFCSGARAAQEVFEAGFWQSPLPILPGADKTEMCWRCRDCDFNAPDGDALLFGRIEFKTGIRYRWKFLARSHMPYICPKEAIRSRYQYGCLFCMAEGRNTNTFHDVDALMSHIKDKHSTQLTPGVKDKTRCVVGSLAAREDDAWDCNIPDVTMKKNAIGKFFIHSVTSLPT